MKQQPIIQNYINHICLVLDESASMWAVKNELVKVADNQVAYLAQRSKDLDQETRITVYAFNGYTGSRCLIYDKDVLRMPSIASLYQPAGNTPLIDATLLALGDLKMTPEKYGEHAFLIYVLTDGQENASRNRPASLTAAISVLPDHWTVAAFVPDQTGKFEAKKFGFPADNIAVWDATTARGVAEAGAVIRETTERFMQGRKAGIRGSRSLFKLDTVETKDIKKALTPLTPGSWFLLDVEDDGRIDEFYKANVGPYSAGVGWYQLTKTETIQDYKQIAVLADGKLYSGKLDTVRSLLGLPDHTERVNPGNQKHKIFVQSTSFNRKLIGGTQLLVFR